MDWVLMDAIRICKHFWGQNRKFVIFKHCTENTVKCAKNAFFWGISRKSAPEGIPPGSAVLVRNFAHLGWRVWMVCTQFNGCHPHLQAVLRSKSKTCHFSSMCGKYSKMSKNTFFRGISRKSVSEGIPPRSTVLVRNFSHFDGCVWMVFTQFNRCHLHLQAFLRSKSKICYFPVM